MRKKVVNWILTVCVAVMLVPNIAAKAEYGDWTKYGDYLYYETNKDGTEVTITYCDEAVTDVVIPDEIESIPVTRIDISAFAGHENLRSVKIGNNVKVIDSLAFEACANLTNVEISQSVTEIANGVFGGCNSLTQITIPGNVETIGMQAFQRCTALVDLTIENGVKVIEWRAFWYTGLTSVTIPDSVEELQGDAFRYCSGLTNVKIGKGIDRIGSNTFEECTSLKSIVIPDNIASIGDYAFYKCTNLDDITLPRELLSIGANAFTGTAYRENSDNWENGVLYISNYLISSKYGVDNVIIKDDTRIICDLALSHCDFTSITIPNSVIYIGESAFANCYSLESITIHDSVTHIGEWAFKGCRNLSKIQLPHNITSIGYEAFNDTEYYNNADNWEDGLLYINEYLIAQKYETMQEARIKDGTKLICNRVHYTYSPDLNSVVLPEGLQYIGDYAFNGCENLKSITIPDSVTEIGDYVFNGCESLEDIIIPNNITHISEGMFGGCTALKKITIPNSVISIGKGAFGNCESLISVTIPNSVISIGNDAFGNCESLISVTIPNSITSIGEAVFGWCYNLTSITIPSSVTNIGDYAFIDCNKIKDVYYNGTKDDWHKINISTEGNEDLLNANIHFNSVPATKPEIIGTPVVEQVSDDVYNISVSLENVEYESQMIAIFSDDTTITGVNSTQLSAGDVSKTLTVNAESATTVKIFIWDSLQGMRPLCEAKTISIE